MKTRRSMLLLAGLVILTLTLSGCLGGGGTGVTNQTVEEFIEEANSAISSLRSGRIAELIDFPISTDYGIPVGLEVDEEEPFEFTRQMFMDLLDEPLDLARDGGATLVFEIRNPEGQMKILIDETEKYAVIQYAEAYILLNVSEGTAEQVVKKALLNYISLMEELYGEPEPAEEEPEFDPEAIADEFWASLRQMVSDGEWPGEFEAEFEIPFIPLKLIAGKWKISLEALFAEYDFDDGGLAGIMSIFR
jgi:hypothetical protein